MSGPTPNGGYEVNAWPLRPAEACCGEDDLKPDDELRDALAETRRIGRVDERDEIHAIEVLESEGGVVA